MRGVRPDRTAAEAALDAMGKPDLVIVALSLAALSSPFGDLDISLLGVDLAETDRSLSEAVLSEFALVEADLIRHRLWSLPAMREGEEPGGLSWFAFGLSSHTFTRLTQRARHRGTVRCKRFADWKTCSITPKNSWLDTIFCRSCTTQSWTTPATNFWHSRRELRMVSRVSGNCRSLTEPAPRHCRRSQDCRVEPIGSASSEA
jgi:hypothetical protein